VIDGSGSDIKKEKNRSSASPKRQYRYMVITGAPKRLYRLKENFFTPQREHPKNTGSLTLSRILRIPVMNRLCPCSTNTIRAAQERTKMAG
jgi:hypothetical protein